MRNPCRLNVIGGFSPGASKEEEEVKKSQTEECPALVEPIVSSRIPWVLLYSEETLDFGLWTVWCWPWLYEWRRAESTRLFSAQRRKRKDRCEPLTSDLV